MPTKGSKVPEPRQIYFFLSSVTLLSQYTVYHTNFAELDLDGSGVFESKLLGEYSELQTLNEFSNECVRSSVVFSRPAYVDLSGLTCISSHNVLARVNVGGTEWWYKMITTNNSYISLSSNSRLKTSLGAKQFN